MKKELKDIRKELNSLKNRLHIETEDNITTKKESVKDDKNKNKTGIKRKDDENKEEEIDIITKKKNNQSNNIVMKKEDLSKNRIWKKKRASDGYIIKK